MSGNLEFSQFGGYVSR
jgi:hypothetical protein